MGKHSTPCVFWIDTKRRELFSLKLGSFLIAFLQLLAANVGSPLAVNGICCASVGRVAISNACCDITARIEQPKTKNEELRAM